jgi:hypothetical protein
MLPIKSPALELPNRPAILNMVQGQTAEAVTIRTAVLKEEGMLLERAPGKIDLCGAPHE